MTVFFENDHAIIVDKPVNWLSTPGRDPKDQRPILGIELQEKLKTQIFPIHRLDAEVSGLIMFGKSASFHRAANTLFEMRLIKKTYQALTPATTFQVGEHYIWKSKLLRGKKRTYEAAYGKPSETHAHLLEEKNKVHNWHLSPITGRAHQLRFEMFKQGFPILGDSLYGSTILWEPGGIALRAIHLILPEDFSSKWGLSSEYFAEPLKF